MCERQKQKAILFWKLSFLFCSISVPTALKKCHSWIILSSEKTPRPCSLRITDDLGMDDAVGDLPTITDYDYSNYSFLDMYLTPEKTSLSPIVFVALILYGLVFLIGTLGNGAVIWVMVLQMQRVVSSVWFLNLSVADMLCCLSLPLLAMPLLSEKKRWLLGDFACKFVPSLIILNMFASILLLTLISMDRCALVVKPVWCQNHRSAGLAWRLCGAAWTVALLLTLPSFMTRSTKDYHNLTVCGVDYGIFGQNHKTAEISVAIVRFLLGFLIPFVAISLFYGLLILRIQSSRFTRSKRTLKVVLVVIMGFFICWFPYHVTGLILAQEDHQSPLFLSVSQWEPLTVALAYTNSCMNPVIYVIAGQGFKAKLQHSLIAALRNILSEETVAATSQAERRAQRSCTTTEDLSTNTTL